MVPVQLQGTGEFRCYEATEILFMYSDDSKGCEIRYLETADKPDCHLF